ncbi:hypothetical protein PDO_1175 [Rhizobium sp. PDO1-076]|nr:hypothetical protein PDO_1175 [Rhizobium sp. PDO1-076]
MTIESYLSDFETPRIVPLSANLHAAQFRLMKLLPARFMLDRAEERGLLKRGSHIVETSSGTFALALAMLSVERGYTLTIVTATSLMDASFMARLEQLDASVILVEDENRTGNQGGRLAALHRVFDSRPDAFGRNNMIIPTILPPMRGLLKSWSRRSAASTALLAVSDRAARCVARQAICAGCFRGCGQLRWIRTTAFCSGIRLVPVCCAGSATALCRKTWIMP